MEAQKFHNLFDRRPIAKSRAPATKWFKEWKKGFRVRRRKEWSLQSLRLRRLLPDVLRGCMIEGELVVTVPKGPHEEDGEDGDIEAEHLVFVQ
nr:Transcription factor YY2 [Ipomoea batatas]